MDEKESIPQERFLKSWNGRVLRFQRINTALCFSIIAREHKLDLTQERFRHEYGLCAEEIPHAVLLRMSKDLGLKAKLLKLDLNRLIHLKKAYPALARKKNGRHVMVVGILSGDREEKVCCCMPPTGLT